MDLNCEKTLLITIDEAALTTGVKSSTIYSWIHRGKLNGTKMVINGHRRYLVDINDVIDIIGHSNCEIHERSEIEDYNKMCKERGRMYMETHKEKRRENQRIYLETHKERVKMREKKYCETHKEEISKRYKAYYEAHKEEISERKKEWYKKRKEEKSKIN